MNRAESAINNFRKDLGKVNILIAGRTGVGKSTLINSIFNQNLAVTDCGRPVTQEIKEYSKPEYPISIIDTKGLELKDYRIILQDLKNYINKRQSNDDPHKKIHVAWVCVAEVLARYEDAEKELVEMLSQFMPVIIVLTKLNPVDQGLQIKIRKESPIAKAVIRVQSISYHITDDYVMKPKNLEELAKLTNEILPEALEKAFISSQKVNIELQENESRIIIKLYSTAAKIMRDEYDMIFHGISIITDISGVFGYELDKEFVISVAVINFYDRTSKFKKFLKKVFRFLPGVHTKLTPAKASAKVRSFGESYLESLLKAFNKNPNVKPTENEIKGILYDICIKSI